MEPNLQEYWEEIGIQNADPMDSPETLLIKSAQILERYFNYYERTLPEPHTWLDLAQSLANKVTPADIVAQTYLNLIAELQNPGSELYIEAVKIILSWH